MAKKGFEALKNWKPAPLIFKGFKVEHDEDLDLLLINAPAGCGACQNGTQDGHFACSEPPAELVAEEEKEDSLVYQAYVGGTWQWVLDWRGLNQCQ